MITRSFTVPTVCGLTGLLVGVVVTLVTGMYQGRTRAEFLFLEGDELVQSGQLNAAAERLSSAITLDGHLCGARELLGNIYEREHDAVAAISTYLGALECLRGPSPHAIAARSEALRSGEILRLEERIGRLKGGSR